MLRFDAGGARSFLDVGTVKQTQRILDAQNPPHRLVHRGLRHRPGAHQLNEVSVEPVFHVHVNTRQKRFASGCSSVIGDAVLDELVDRVVVAYYKSAEFPLVPQHTRQGEGVRRGGDLIKRVESAHQRGSARIHGRLEGRQVNLAQRALRHVHGVIVASAFRGPVADVVLYTGCDGIRSIKPRALISDHIGARHGCTEVRIFAGPFHNAPPAGVARDIDHRGEGPSDAGG